MAFVGLDFGTTTSILSYLDGRDPRSFHYGGQATGTPYIPSVVAYRRQGLLIGQHAAEMLPTEASVYRYFKMLLPEEDRGKWNGDFGPYASEERQPARVAADFIGELVCGTSPGRKSLSLDRDREAFLPVLGAEIERLVVSVPYIWDDIRAHGRQQLREVVKDVLGLPLTQLISEPVAAAAYFAHLYLKKQTEPYRGNVLICDMGGGTFDVTLCQLGHNRVDVLCNAGNGERGLGVAGAHFDHALLDLKLPGGVKPDVRAELLRILDSEKKTSRKSTNILERYLLEDNPQERVEPIYALRSMTTPVVITYDDVCAAFAAVRDGITRVLTEITEKAERGGHAINKIIMVGGFSQFPLVQQAVREFFGEDVFGGPQRIDLDTLRRDDMAFAISYGACLVAGGIVHVSEIYEHTISIVAFEKQGEKLVGQELELIGAHKSLGTLEETAFCLREDGDRHRFKITGDAVNAQIFIKLYGRSDVDDKLVTTLSLTDVPNSDVPGNLWFIGARVDKSKIPYLVLEDEQRRKVKEYPLGDLIPPIIVKD